MNRILQLAIVCWVISLMTVPVISTAGESSCQKKTLNLCDDDKGALVCKLLSYNKPETVKSISEFLKAIKKLDSEMQKDFICARLMKQKQITINTELAELPDESDRKYTFKSGFVIFRFGIDDPDYIRLIEARHELEKLKLCPTKAVEFEIMGMVIDADAEYDEEYRDSTLKSFKIVLDNVKFLRIKTRFAEGGFDVQIKSLEKKRKEEYSRLLNTGVGVEVRKDLKTYKNSIGMEFVLVPSGSFDMGVVDSGFECNKNNETPEAPHKVIISKPFYISKFEVTQGQWKAVMSNNPWKVIIGNNNPSSFKNCGDNCPVENVSWDDVQEFIGKLNQKEGGSKYRLPIEAEWEYAARAGSTTAYCFRDDEGRLEQYAWYDGNSGSKTHPVGKLLPNAWGLYDMHGNVWEWCQDWYTEGSTRVLRGGCWYYNAQNCRSASRDPGSPGYRDNRGGFRLVRLP